MLVILDMPRVTVGRWPSVLRNVDGRPDFHHRLLGYVLVRMFRARHNIIELCQFLRGESRSNVDYLLSYPISSSNLDGQPNERNSK